ncbi:MAG: PD40 domain-containing protein [Chloroflexi bacterium]|nr:PD40 domain-containing protein [Chloroflexota bacterium]
MAWLSIGSVAAQQTSFELHGKLLTSACSEDTDTCGLFLEDFDTLERRYVTQSPIDSGIIDHSGTLSPDGTRIAFISNRSGNDDVFLVGITGRNLRLLGGTLFPDSHPLWSPDGSRLVFRSLEPGDKRLHVITVNTVAIQTLTAVGLNAHDAAWSPDGESLVFLGGSGPNSSIYTIESDGSGLAPLMVDLYYAAKPRWSPNGDAIAFLASEPTGTPSRMLHVMGPDGSGLNVIAAALELDLFGWLSDDTLVIYDFMDGVIAIDKNGLNRQVLLDRLTYFNNWAYVFDGTPSPFESISMVLLNSLTGTIVLPGRAIGTSTYAVNLDVKLAQDGTTVSEHFPTTDANGYFTLPDLPQGSYNVWLKQDQSLAVMPSVVLDAPSVTLPFGSLAMGDANDDNTINIADFSILAAAFGTSTGQPGYDPRADFNADGYVNITDFSVLAANFGQSGAAPPAGGSQPGLRITETIPPELSSARLRFLTNTGSVSTRVGAAFSVALRAGNSTVGGGSVVSLLDGAEAHLTFDPTKLQVDTIISGLTPGTTLPTVLRSAYDNSAGTIDFAAGTLSAPASGEFTLVTIRFRAIDTTGTGSTLVQASTAPYRENLLTLDGASITPSLTPLSVRIR